jgi:hypothetical protein
VKASDKASDKALVLALLLVIVLGCSWVMVKAWVWVKAEVLGVLTLWGNV